MKIWGTDLSGISCEEYFDDVALEHLKLVDPEAPQKLINRVKEMPIYDDKEVIATAEYFINDKRPMLAMFSFIQGNENPKDNGWALRLFSPVTYNSKEHLAILKAFEKTCNGKMESWD